LSSNTNLGNTPVNQGYVQLIHTGETGGIDGTLRVLYDGDGTASDLQIASNKVKIATELFIGSKTLSLFIQDTVGAMFSGNTETNISVTYQTSDNTIDLVATGAITGLTGGTGIDVTGSGNLTIAIDSTVATQSYVNTQVAGIVDSAPGTLDTLNELAAALGDDANFSTTTATNIATKLAKASNLSDLTNVVTARSNLGLGSLAELNTINGANWSGTDLAIANGGTGASDANTARENLGLEIGLDVQAYDAGLLSIAGLTTSANKMIYTTASDTYATTTLSSTARTLLDDNTTADMLTTLGLIATATELNYTDGVTSNIQTQLNGKLGTSAKAADSELLDGINSTSFVSNIKKYNTSISKRYFRWWRS
jgi:hypothetical protein